MEDGTPVKFIHLGGVVIGDNVEIGSCTCIAKGTLSNTIIEDDVKIDNLVHVAHNCIIRKGAFIIASSVLCGGVDVGENTWVAPNATVTQKAHLGKNSLVGLGAVVTKNVDPDCIVAGNPAKVLRKK
jgi:UDP-3-O-[3-hydroxymyristoyl] glucosamine N-acyltransferase